MSSNKMLDESPSTGAEIMRDLTSFHENWNKNRSNARKEFGLSQESITISLFIIIHEAHV